ncbi:DUF4139 domain-containing protein [Chiayiivirga flava]|uniref:DUF4139 domain-containing protein n=1 Tax=Chiayiivirga flava TaxID=659595 RepID=A0A7W8D7M0_9GAMM|nr:DUF4139 domain-containing protein [Chiayiivirga flava]MBB5209414.1 hypothetical protein [Chiayiivirga flava]
MRIAPLASATLIALASHAAAAQADTRGATITLYSGDYETLAAGHGGVPAPGFALVRDTFDASLQRGNNEITRSGFPASIDSAAVQLLPQGSGVAVASQRFDFALADQDELLRRSIGKQITVVQAVGTAEKTYTGTLVAAGNGLTIADPSGGIRVLSNYSSFLLAQLPEGVSAQPTLRWNIASDRSGRETFALDYPTGGLAWRAEYLATVSGAGSDCRMDFDGAAQIVNRSGASFDDAAVTLVAGEPNVQRAGKTMAYDRMEMRAMAAAPAPEPQASGEYHAYTLPERVDLPDGSVQRATLLDGARDVRCTRRYETRSPMQYYRPGAPIIEPQFGATGTQPVQAMLAFDNDKASRLGMPLPAGRLRVYEAGASGNAFLGEAALDHTAAGRKVDVALGQAFDLQAERTQKELRLAEDRLSLTETIEIAVTNAKPEAATVRVLEALPRWSDWDIVESSVPSTRSDAQTVAFELPVPAGGKATVRYVVRYRWPASVKP